MFTCTCVTYTYRTLIETEIWDFYFYILSVYSGSVTKYLLEYEKKNYGSFHEWRKNMKGFNGFIEFVIVVVI